MFFTKKSLNAVMSSVAVSALLMFAHTAKADIFSYDDPTEVDIDESWLGTEVSVKWGSQDAQHDRDGILSYSDTIGAIGVGSLYADVVSSGTGIVKSKTGWFEHSPGGANLATSTQSLKPFTIEGTGTQTVSMTISIDGLMAVDEDSADVADYSRAVLSYMTDIQTVGADGVRDIVGNNTFDGYVLVGSGADIADTDPDDYGASVVSGDSYYNVPEYVSDDDMGGHENTWYNNSGLIIKKVVELVTDADTEIDNEDALLDGTDADVYIADGRETYYVVYSQTFTFDAVAGQQYFVAMDLFTGIRVSDGAATADGWAMSDFSNTITYSLSGGTGVTTSVLIDDAHTQSIDGNNPFGGANTKVTLDDAELTLTAPAAMSEKYILAVGSENKINTGANAGSISGVISGSGELEKLGAGSLTLSGANTYTGETIVSEGSVVLGASGVLADTGSVNVGVGATLNVNGQTETVGAVHGVGSIALGGGNLIINERSAPGNSIGTLTVTGAGTYTQGATSEMQVEINEAGGEDLLNITNGNVVIVAGAKLVPVASDTITTGQTYTFMTAGAGTITGTFTIEDNYGVLSFTANNTGNAYTLTLTRDSYASAVEVAGAAGVASALDDILSDGGIGAEMQAMMDIIDAMDTDDINDAYEGLMPDVTGASVVATNNITGQVQGLVSGRLGAVRSSGVSSGDEFVNKVAWIQSFYTKADQDNRNGYNGYEADTYGFALGMDGDLSDSLTIGIAYGYGDTDSDSVDSGLEFDSHTVMLYGSYNFAPEYYLDAMASYGVGDYDSRRDTVMGTAFGDYEGSQFALRADVSRPCSEGNVTVVPMVNVKYSHASMDGYQETGAPGANLYVDKQDSDTVTTGAGVKASMNVQQNEEWSVKPEISAVVSYDVIQDDVSSTSRFVSGGGAFTTKGLTPSRASIEVGGNLAFSKSDGLDIVVDYKGEYRNDYDSHTGLLRLRQSF